MTAQTSLAERIYDNNMKVVDLIDKHEILKDDIYYRRQNVSAFPALYRNLALFLKDYEKQKKRCKRTCWADFIKNYLFVKEKVPIATSKYVYNIYPNVNLRTNIMDPRETPIFDSLPNNARAMRDEFNIRYDFRTKLVYSNFYNILMLDYDIKDGISREDAIEELHTIVNIGKRNNLNFTFAVMPTDRGIHAFLLSQRAYRNMFWVDLLRLACTDPYYAAFSYATGFGIRLSKKHDTPNDLVSWLSPLNPPIIPDNDENPDVQLSEIIDIGYPTFEFTSRYLNRTITMKVFGNQLQFIGDPRNVLDELYYELQLQYLFLQYFRSFSTQEIENIECEIYNAAIFPYTSAITILQQDIFDLKQRSQGL